MEAHKKNDLLEGNVMLDSPLEGKKYFRFKCIEEKTLGPQLREQLEKEFVCSLSPGKFECEILDGFLTREILLSQNAPS